MGADHSILSLFFDAGWVVKLVLFLLLLASVLSWTFIFQRWQVYRETQQQLAIFEAHFWSNIDAQQYYQQLSTEIADQTGINSIFLSGFSEYKRLLSCQANNESMLEAMQRAMRAAQNRESERLEMHLPFLATVGSTSPYIGLFGTVWGIMTAFSALNTVQQATIQMVAPGISEALVATAIGLFAAIPAVIAYNRFSHQVEQFSMRYESFQEEFTNSIRAELLSKG